MHADKQTGENFIEKAPVLLFSEERVNLCMEPGTIKEGSFVIREADGRKARGRIYTTHWRMQPRTNSRFQGAEAEFSYIFDSTGMQYGDTVKGLFLIVSDAGEYRLPFAVTAQPGYITTPEGKLKNLAAFVSLTERDMDAAYQAFSHPRFSNTLAFEDKKLLQWYRGLTRNGVTYSSMIAFLKVTGNYQEPVKTPALKSQLKKFYAESRVDYGRREFKQKVVQLFRLYLQFRGMSLSLEKWASQTKELLEDLMAKGKYKDFYYMVMVHVCLLEGQRGFAGKMLDDYADSHYDLQKNAELYGYYLYLCALHRRSEPFLEQTCRRIRGLYEHHKGSGALLWMLLMVDKELLTDEKKRCKMMEEQYHMGVRTPILYMEAAMLYRQNPELVKELSDYEVQILVFAKRYHLLNQELMDRVTKLALRYREFSEPIYMLLAQCYEANPQDQCIHAICTLLIKGNKIGGEYFQWYEKGVQANLRITRLYDYYLYSMEETMERPLPEAVLMYFQYNQDLDYRKKAYLFANLTRYQKEYPDLYDAYYQDMIDFVLRQLEKGRVNTHLIYLYQHMVNRQYISQRNAYYIADFIFSREITDIPSDAANVVVAEPALAEEITVPVSGGVAIAPVYTEDACLFYQDSKGNRQAIPDLSAYERWFEREELLELCARYCPAHPGIMLQKCRALTEGKDPQWQITLAQMTAESQFSLACRMELWQQMLDHFYRVYDNDSVEWCLKHVQIEALPDEKRSRNIELLLLQGQYEEAFAYVKTYGCEHIADKPMIRMCSRMICKKEFARDENLLAVCREIFFRGRYDEIMLGYLLDHMEGGTAEMEQIWQAGEQFGLDTYHMAKRLIERMLYTGCVPDRIFEIFESYYQAKGKENLVLAFLAYFADRIVKRGLVADLRIYEWIRKELARGEELNEICRIAWLYGISRHPSLLEGSGELAGRVLGQLLLDGRYFAFYRDLPQSVKEGRLFMEQSYLEYKTDPAHRVYVHYLIEGQDEDRGFRVEEMEQSFPGIFVKEVPLFSEDTMQYYITEQYRDREWIVKTGRLGAEERQEEADDRFAHMDKILTADSAEEKERLAEEYCRRSYVSEKLFQCL